MTNGGGDDGVGAEVVGDDVEFGGGGFVEVERECDDVGAGLREGFYRFGVEREGEARLAVDGDFQAHGAEAGAGGGGGGEGDFLDGGGFDFAFGGTPFDGRGDVIGRGRGRTGGRRVEYPKTEYSGFDDEDEQGEDEGEEGGVPGEGAGEGAVGEASGGVGTLGGGEGGRVGGEFGGGFDAGFELEFGVEVAGDVVFVQAATDADEPGRQRER
jgi:hypothetical protein